MTKIDKKEITVSFLKSAFSAIPYAGAVLNEIFFDYSGRVKQERLNRFTNLLSDFFSQNTNIDLENMRTEEFSDLLEAVLRKVVLTKSEEKLVRFRDILTNNIKTDSILLDNSELYLDLISNLAEIEIKILQYHISFDRSYEIKREKLQKNKEDLLVFEETQKKEFDLFDKGYANNYDQENKISSQKKMEISILSSELESVAKYRNNSFYQITEDQFLYHKQKLQSLGLLIDTGIGGIGVHSFELMSITEFGKDFLKFLVSKSED